MKFNFNAIANAISVASGVTLAGIIGVGSYVYLNKDAIINDIKDAAIESVVGGMGTGAAGGALKSLPSADIPLGTNDLPSAAPNQAAAPALQTPVQF
tara:strand:+ start:832 stop:1122 length:291 start_codon:yes stop_codon:yes gene_type:complete